MRLRTPPRMQSLTYSQTRFYRSNSTLAMVMALLIGALVVLASLIFYRQYSSAIVAAYQRTVQSTTPSPADVQLAEQQLRLVLQKQNSQINTAREKLIAMLSGDNARLSRDEFFNVARPILKEHSSVAAVTYFVPTTNQAYAEAEGRMFAETIPGYVSPQGEKLFFPVRYRLAAADGRADLLSAALAQSPLTASTLYNAFNGRGTLVMSPIIGQSRTLWLMQSVISAKGTVEAVVALQIDVSRWHENNLPNNVAVRFNNVSSPQLDAATTMLGNAVAGQTLLKNTTFGVAPTFLMMGIFDNAQLRAPIQAHTALVTPANPAEESIDTMLWAGIVLAMVTIGGVGYWMLMTRTQQAAYLWQKLQESRLTISEISELNERKHQDDAVVTDSDRIFKQLLQSTDVIPWIANLYTQTFVYIGPQAQEKIGHPMTVWRSTGFLIRHLHPDDRELFGQRLQVAKAEHGTLTHEYRIRRTDGTIRWMRYMFSLAHNNMPESQLVHGFMTDITEQKNAQDTMRLARDTAERANRTKSEFLATMSHELRTPLNAIIGFSEIIHQEILGPINNDKYREYVKNIHVSGKHLLDLINDVLDLSKIEAGHLELQEEEVLLSDIIESCRSLVAERAQRSEVKLEVYIPTPGVMLVADGRRLKQVLINLLSNSIKFTAAGGQVTLNGILNADNSVHLVVEDTGVGMEANQIPRALEKFRQADSGASRAHEGTGLGLPIAKSLTELHGGTLLLESVYGQGTTVTIALPASRVHVQPKGAQKTG